MHLKFHTKKNKFELLLFIVLGNLNDSKKCFYIKKKKSTELLGSDGGFNPLFLCPCLTGYSRWSRPTRTSWATRPSCE